MNTPIAIGLAALVLLLVIGDTVLDHGQVLLFLARKATDLVEWVAFWR